MPITEKSCCYCNPNSWTTDICPECEALIDEAFPKESRVNMKAPFEGEERAFKNKWDTMTQKMLERPSPFYDVLLKAADTHFRKNTNYASKEDPFSNFKMCEVFGVQAPKGVLVRMSDKWSRICNLANGVEDLVGESLMDTILDLGVYSFILYAMLQKREE